MEPERGKGVRRAGRPPSLWTGQSQTLWDGQGSWTSPARKLQLWQLLLLLSQLRDSGPRGRGGFSGHFLKLPGAGSQSKL